jgi:serine phosphatase RsbU (regulator of sigma subunit)
MYTPEELNARLTAIEQLRELKRLYRSSIHEQVVAKQILSAALSARNIAVEGMRLLNRSAAIFSGDLVLSARNPNGGLNILLADFTGHGLSAAIGVLPVADMFSVMTEKGFGPEIILKNINTKLYTLLPTGMFMAACMVEIKSNSRSACVWNSGMPDVYLLDGESGRVKQKISSTHIPLGISQEIDNRLEFDDFDITPGDQFVLHSDGLTDVTDSSGNMFGTNRLEHIMENSPNHTVFDAIKNEFDRFCMNQALLDDATLITLPCAANLGHSLTQDVMPNIPIANSTKGGWRFMMEVSGSSLRDIDPVPIILDQYRKLGNLVVCADRLQCILSVLYDNALNHGVLELSHLLDSSLQDNNVYDQERNKRFDQIPYGFIRIEIEEIIYQGNSSLLLRLEDSGRGFDHVGVLSDISRTDGEEQGVCLNGIPLAKRLCQSLHYQGRGNRVEAIVGGRQ